MQVSPSRLFRLRFRIAHSNALSIHEIREFRESVDNYTAILARA